MADSQLIEVLRTEPHRFSRITEGRPADLRDADLSGLRLEGIDLREADLRGARFTGSTLLRCNFYAAMAMRADFSRTDARGSIFTDADLRDARFDEANLIGASLAGSYLKAASFRDADLCICNLSNAVLDQTDLTGAKVNDTAFNHLDLTGAILVDLVYQGRCDVGYATLTRTAQRTSRASMGALEAFLRGIGIAEEGLQAFRDLVGSEAQWFDAFISYSHQDAAFAERLYEFLQGRGVRCWLDREALSPGDPLLEAVNRGVRVADKLLLCCSAASLASWFVRDELQKALDDERRHEVSKVVPLDLDGSLHDWDHGLAAALRSRVAVDFREWTEPAPFATAATSLLRALRAS
ncbi:MAG: toll/interleukin-1 receptor domain-containing protein, partial [Myxococcota bacterium]